MATSPPAAKKLKLLRASESSSDFDVSVLVPCNNAMPWLPHAVRSPLVQSGLAVEVIVADDWSTDGSTEWLDALAAELGPERARVEREAAPRDGTENPALVVPLRPESTATPNFGAAAPASEQPAPLQSAAECAAAVLASEASRSFLRVVSSHGRGQAAALQTALDCARAPLIAHIEADDEYGPDRLALMLAALGADETLDAVFSPIELFGDRVSASMTRYVEWQNELLAHDDLERARFVEMPSLHQTGLYRASALRACAIHSGGGDAARALTYREPAAWPVDYDFVMRFFAAGLRAAKLRVRSDEGRRSVYRWRQHTSNGTRWQGRCSVDALRACKLHYFSKAARAPAPPPAEVQLWSIGKTLGQWEALLRSAGLAVLSATEWNPKHAFVPAKAVAASDDGGDGAEAAPEAAATSTRRLRVFAYGSSAIRLRVLEKLGRQWDPARDWFVA